jgi:hypothetical protein
VFTVRQERAISIFLQIKLISWPAMALVGSHRFLTAEGRARSRTVHIASWWKSDKAHARLRVYTSAFLVGILHLAFHFHFHLNVTPIGRRQESVAWIP